MVNYHLASPAILAWLICGMPVSSSPLASSSPTHILKPLAKPGFNSSAPEGNDGTKDTIKKKGKSKRSAITNSKQGTTTKFRSDTVRRIQREWKDVVQAGMGYDWVRRQPVLAKKKKEKTQPTHEASSASSPHQQHIWLGPLHRQNLMIWHFSFVGLEQSPYQNGIYHGRIVLPDNYPAAPPEIQVWTPSGRFKPRHAICLEASSFHPETWMPSQWTLQSLVQGLRLHMLTEAMEIGGIRTCSVAQRRVYARESQTWQSPSLGTVSSTGRTIRVHHADMIRQGLFPLVAEPDEADEPKSMTEPTPDDDDDVLDQYLERLVADETSIERAVQSARAPWVKGVVKTLNSPVRLAAWGFLVLFLLLNRW